MKKSIFALLPLILSCISCDDDNGGKNAREEIILTPAEESIVKSNYSLGASLLSELAEDNGNVIISPLSLSMNLSMVAEGANGPTLNDILGVLVPDAQSIDNLSGFNKKLLKSMPRLDRSASVKLANSIWINKQYESHLVDRYATTMLDFYNAQVNAIDMSGNTMEIINKWCDDNTSGMIPRILNRPLEDETMMLSANALYFKGQWKEKFDKHHTRQEYFHNNSGTLSTVKMMNNILEVHYVDNAGFTAVALPFGNEAYSLIVVLPKPDSGSLWSSEAEIDDIIRLARNETASRLFDVKLPRFEISYSRELVSVLADIGLSLPFSMNADFSNILDIEQVKLSTVLHAAKITVDEDGAEASAVTGSGDIATGPEDAVQFYVDRPFTFILTEQSTGIALFMGQVNRL